MKVQWVDFKLENVLVSLHSLKTMGLGPFGASAPLFLRNGESLGHSPIHPMVMMICSLYCNTNIIMTKANINVQFVIPNIECSIVLHKCL